MAEIPLTTFFKNYTEALRQHSAAVFVGAGLSRGCGYSDWRELLREVATDLALEVDRERDLLAVAQFHVNRYRGRHRLNQVIVQEFTKRVTLGPNHRLLAQLPVHTIWTTNYDTLLEQTLAESNRRCDVKHSQDQLAVTLPYRDVTLYKMHGDVSRPDEAILTKEDYEIFGTSRQLFSEALKGDLVSKTFLFLGFSFEDPNIDYILGRIRVLLGQNRREHYCIMRKVPPPVAGDPKAKADYEYDVRRHALRVDDLGRYGIQTILIDDFADITNILEKLARHCHLWDVFVSGSAHECNPFGIDKLHRLSRLLGAALIENGFNLISGFGLGVGSDVLMGAAEACTRSSCSLDERLHLYPFPQGLKEEERKRMWPAYREQMIDRSGCVVFLCGNKWDIGRGKVVMADGVLEEFNICKRLGRYPVPVGVTGYAASQVYDDVMANMKAIFGGKDVSKELKALNEEGTSEEALIEAILSMITKLQQP